MGTLELAAFNSGADGELGRTHLDRRVPDLAGTVRQLVGERTPKLERLCRPNSAECTQQDCCQGLLVPRAASKRYGLFGKRDAAREITVPRQLLRLKREQTCAVGRVRRVVEL